MNWKIEKFIKNNPGIDTRTVIDVFSGPLIPRQKIAGHLSWLVRNDRIYINTLIKHKFSKAY